MDAERGKAGECGCAGDAACRRHRRRKEPNGLKRELSLGKPIDVRDAGSPLSLSVARSQPIASGATIRTVPDRSQVVFCDGAAQ